MLSITLDVPSELSTPLSISGYNQEKLTEEAKRLLAISLFERNILSLGQAAKLAELHLWDFIRLLSQQDIPIAEYDDEEIQQELKAVECLDTTNRVTDSSGLIVVADASFVIGISLCEQWDTLKVLAETLIIADEVWKEVVEQGEGKPGEKELRQATFVERQTVSNMSAVTMLMATLDKGEAETLVLATELGLTNVFVDDLRRAEKLLNL